MQNNVNILTSWCTCMAGTSQYCNHGTTCPYKIEYVNTHGYIDLLCTSTACAWIKNAKEKTEPK